MFFSPLNSNPAAASDAAALTTTTTNTSPTINTSPYPDPQTKASLNLPTTAEGWETANSYFHTSLVPAVLGVQEMNRMLYEGIYSYFSSSFCTKTLEAPPSSQSISEGGGEKEKGSKERVEVR